MYFYLPITPNGYSVIYHKLSNTKPSNYVFDEAIKTYLMTIGEFLGWKQRVDAVFGIFITIIFFLKTAVCTNKVHVMGSYFCLT